jgi:hypothetical protein
VSDNLGMGIDNLPFSIKTSTILNGNDLAQLASIDVVPSFENVEKDSKTLEEKHTVAKQYIKAGNINEAWKILLA